MRGALHCFLRRALRRHSTVATDATDAAASLMDRSSSSERYSYSPSLVWNPEVEAYFVKAYGADHFDRISKSLTHPSSYSCIRVNTLKTTTGEVIRKIRTILEEQRVISSSGCLNVNGENGALDVDRVLKEGSFNGGLGIDILLEDDGVRGDSDAIMMNIDRCSIDKCKYPSMDNVVIVRGSGPHLLQYNSQNKQPMKEIIVSRKCAESVLRGAQVFVPGVLACSAHVEKGDLVAVSVAVEQRGSDGGWGFGITRGTVLQGLHSDPQYCERNGLYIGQGIALMSRAGIFRASEGVAVEMTQRVYRLPSLHDVLEGEIFLQNLPSIVAAHVLDPQEGERILDMCAAPGGKTTAIAILMKDKGEVIAIDRSHNKVMDILKLAAEMGLTCINAYKLDALRSVCQAKEIVNAGVEDRDREATETVVEEAHGDIISGNPTKCCNIIDFMGNGHNAKADQRRCRGRDDNKKNTVYRKNGPGRNHCKGGRVRNSKGYAPNSFDRVLLDAPCSALGLRPRLFAGEETLESLRNHAKYQRRMFDRAVQLVRPGGVIVYSTCTINPGENEALVRYALDTYKFLSLAPQNPRIGGPGLVGGCELFDGKFVEEWLTESEAELVQRFDPSSSLDTIGFFIAKFRVGQEVQGELEERR